MSSTPSDPPVKPESTVTVHEDAESLIRSSDLVVFATTAGEPHVTDPSWFEHHPLVLHISLRDLGPEVVLAATNIVDDVEHCLKAQTSVHLTEQFTGSRDFLAGTLYDVMTGTVEVPAAARALASSSTRGSLRPSATNAPATTSGTTIATTASMPVSRRVRSARPGRGCRRSGAP